MSKSYSYLAGTSGINSVYTGMLLSANKQFYYDNAGRLVAEGSTKTLHNAGMEHENIVYLYDESAIIGMVHTLNGVTNTYYFHRNPLGDVVGIYNTSGTLVAKYTYDAWGNFTISGDLTVAKANPIRYRGYYYDEDTGLYYCNARYYSPTWRRFISPDDTAYLDPSSVNGLNQYCYCGNDPINYADPSGHWIETVFDLFSLGASVVEVVLNPADPWAWAGLVGDAVDLLPFVTGVGEGVKAAKLVKYTDEMIDASHTTIKFAKAANYAGVFADGGLDLARALDRTSDGFTIANRLDGIKIHKSFMNNGLNIRGTRLQVDGLDDVAQRVYELKPYNRRNLVKGVKQILNYNHNMALFLYGYLAMLPFLNLVVLLCQPSKKKPMMPGAILIDNEYIEYQSQQATVCRNISDVKVVRDYGEFYDIISYFGKGSDFYVCQKDMLSRGTLEDFEKLFEGKIVRMTKNAK